MRDRVNQTILSALRREETHLLARIQDPDNGLQVRAARIKKRAQEVENEYRQAILDLAEVRDEIYQRRT